MDREILKKLMLFMQKKYNGVCEIQRITDEIADAYNRRDAVSVSLTVKMRGDSMVAAGAIDDEINDILENLAENDFIHCKKLIKWNEQEPAFSFEEEKIAEISVKIHNILEKTIEKDKIINRQIAGEESYYLRK